jgi:hypothetical protein
MFRNHNAAPQGNYPQQGQQYQQQQQQPMDGQQQEGDAAQPGKTSFMFNESS